MYSMLGKKNKIQSKPRHNKWNSHTDLTLSSESVYCPLKTFSDFAARKFMYFATSFTFADEFWQHYQAKGKDLKYSDILQK